MDPERSLQRGSKRSCLSGDGHEDFPCPAGDAEAFPRVFFEARTEEDRRPDRPVAVGEGRPGDRAARAGAARRALALARGGRAGGRRDRVDPPGPVRPGRVCVPDRRALVGVHPPSGHGARRPRPDVHRLRRPDDRRPGAVLAGPWEPRPRGGMGRFACDARVRRGGRHRRAPRRGAARPRDLTGRGGDRVCGPVGPRAADLHRHVVLLGHGEDQAVPRGAR